jgi:hypothetical protein
MLRTFLKKLYRKKCAKKFGDRATFMFCSIYDLRKINFTTPQQGPRKCTDAIFNAPEK